MNYVVIQRLLLALSSFFLVLSIIFAFFQFETLLYSNVQILSFGIDSVWSRSYLTLSELFLLGFFASYFFVDRSTEKRVPFLFSIALGGLFLSLTIAYFSSYDSLLHILKSRHIIEGVLLLYILLNEQNLHRVIILTCMFIASTEAVLMILQFCMNSSLGLSVLKEPVLSFADLTTAKFHFFDQIHIRSYGTLQHPNIASGVLLSCLFLIVHGKKEFHFLKKWQYHLLLSLIMVGILCAVSKTVFFIIATLVIIWVFSTRYVSSFFTSINKVAKRTLLLSSIALPFLLIFISSFYLSDSSTITDRLLLLQSSFHMFITHPFGVGLGNFIIELQSSTTSLLFPWEYQPVHSFFFLLLNELGVVGFLSLLLLTYSIFAPFLKSTISGYFSISKVGAFLTILAFALIDHFWLTSWIGWLFLIMSISILFIEMENTHQS